jgi:hypothetical protein
MWLDIQFKPDLTKGYPAKWADRNTFVDVSYQVEGSSISNSGLLAPITGRFLMPDAVRAIQYRIGSLAAFIQNNMLYVRPSDITDNAMDIELYDLLGRKTAEWNGIFLTANSNYLALPLPQLVSGMYIVRIGSASCKVMK